MSEEHKIITDDSENDSEDQAGNFNEKWISRNYQPGAENLYLMSPFLRVYFFITGQWFEPGRHLVCCGQRIPQMAWRIAYAVLQITVAGLMWVFFAYSMGFLGVRTVTEIDWLCQLTNLKNVTYALRWIVNQHTGVLFFAAGNCERLFRQLSIKKADIETRGTLRIIVAFQVCSMAFLFVLPSGIHVIQTAFPDFMPIPGYINGTLTRINENPFSIWQIAINVIILVLNRSLSLPILFVFLYMMAFLCCEVEIFREALEFRKYPTEEKAREKAIKIKTLIRDTERAFRFFLVLYISILLVASALEIFSIVEKVEIVISKNDTVHYMPASSLVSYDIQDLKTPGKIVAIPSGVNGKRSYPYLLVRIVSPANESSDSVGMHATPEMETVIHQYKLKTFEIVVTAVQDITENFVLYMIPLYTMSQLKGSLASVIEAVEDSDYGEQTTNVKIFNTRQEKQDFRDYFSGSCSSGVRLLGKEVSFLWTLVITVFGPFVVVVLNLMFKHIHADPHFS